MKNKKIEFALYDDSNLLHFRLVVEGVELLNLEKISSPVRIRAPLPDRNILLLNTKAIAGSSCNKHGHIRELEFYIRCRQKEIQKEIATIRKSIKRINRQFESIEIARSLVSEL